MTKIDAINYQKINRGNRPEKKFSQISGKFANNNFFFISRRNRVVDVVILNTRRIKYVQRLVSCVGNVSKRITMSECAKQK